MDLKEDQEEIERLESLLKQDRSKFECDLVDSDDGLQMDDEPVQEQYKSETVPTTSKYNQMHDQEDHEEIERLNVLLNKTDVCDVNDDDLKLDAQTIHINQFDFQKSIEEAVNARRDALVACDSQTAALYINEIYQKTLTTALKRVEEMLFDIQTRKRQLRQQIQRANVKLDLKPTGRFLAPPYFKTSKITCPGNEDTTTKRNRNELMRTDLQSNRLWNATEKKLLKSSVLSECKRIETQRINRLVKDVIGNLKKEKDEKRKVKLRDDLEKLRDELKVIEDNVFCYSRKDRDVPIDWLKIAQKIKWHRDTECKGIWFELMHPDLNRSEFTDDECTNLKRIVEESERKDWNQIADKLGTNRSAYQCCLKYNLHLNKRSVPQEWSEAEENKLSELVKKHTLGTYIAWPKISSHFPHISKNRIYQHYKYVIEPKNRKKGRFTVVEDARIIELVKKYGMKFALISKHMPNRTCVQIRNRYYSVLQYKGQKIRVPFSASEDQQIVDYVRENGEKKWEKLQKALVSDNLRTSTNLRQRWYVLRKWLADNPDKDVKFAPRSKTKTHTTTPAGELREEQVIATTIPNTEQPANLVISYNVHDLPGDFGDNFEAVYRRMWYYTNLVERDVENVRGIVKECVANVVFLSIVLNIQITLPEDVKYFTQSKSTRFTAYGRWFLQEMMDFRSLIHQTHNQQTNLWSFTKAYANIEHTLTDRVSLPNTLRTCDQFDLTLTHMKLLCTFIFSWHPSRFDDFYSKKSKRRVNHPEPVLLDQIRNDTVARFASARCVDVFPCEKFHAHYRRPRIAEMTIKMRLLGLFRLPETRVMASVVCASADVKMREYTMKREARECLVEVKKKKTVGRPRKRGRSSNASNVSDAKRLRVDDDRVVPAFKFDWFVGNVVEVTPFEPVMDCDRLLGFRETASDLMGSSPVKPKFRIVPKCKVVVGRERSCRRSSKRLSKNVGKSRLKEDLSESEVLRLRLNMLLAKNE